VLIGGFRPWYEVHFFSYKRSFVLEMKQTSYFGGCEKHIW